MNLLKQPMIVVVLIAVLAILAASLGAEYKVAWVGAWLSPILMLLLCIAIATLTTTPPRTVTRRKGKVVWIARTAAFVALVWLFVSIDLVGDAPVSMRLMGMSWTTTPRASASFLQIAGLGIGAIGVGLTTMDARRTAAAAARARSEHAQATTAA